MVCYGFRNGIYQIGDPGVGMVEYSEEALESVWKSHTLLALELERSFKTKADIASQKKKWFKLLLKEDTPLLMLIAISASSFLYQGSPRLCFLTAIAG